VFLEGGYCRITGRFKDIIIRGELSSILISFYFFTTRK